MTLEPGDHLVPGCARLTWRTSRALNATNLALSLTVLSLLCTPALAKRIPPKPVAPVIEGEVKYSAAGDGRDQYVVAEDLKTGGQLWKVKVSRAFIKPWVEEDNQWVFITELKLADHALLIRDERRAVTV